MVMVWYIGYGMVYWLWYGIMVYCLWYGIMVYCLWYGNGILAMVCLQYINLSWCWYNGVLVINSMAWLRYIGYGILVWYIGYGMVYWLWYGMVML
jgi:hypothetical protein